jgi:uncharacterized membrane protein AbrB (regulator of aidB expression)
MTRADLLRLTKALAIGTVGGALFFTLNMPLAWMMGAMVLTTLAALFGVSLHVPGHLRSVMVAILGVLLGSTFTPEALDKVLEWPITLASLALYLLGSTFTPEALDKVLEWPITLASLALYLMVVTGMLYVYFRRVMGFDPATAYFSATPGGLNEMVIVGRAMGGEATIAPSRWCTAHAYCWWC